MPVPVARAMFMWAAAVGIAWWCSSIPVAVAETVAGLHGHRSVLTMKSRGFVHLLGTSEHVFIVITVVVVLVGHGALVITGDPVIVVRVGVII